MRKLPFFYDTQNAGFMILEGILSVDKGKIHIEYQKKDAVIEVVKSSLKTFEVDLNEIDHIEFKKNIFSARLIIHAKSASVFQDFPGNELLTRTLKVKRKHREIAMNISSNLNLFLSEKKLRELDEELK